MSNAGMSISSPKWKMRQVDNHPKTEETNLPRKKKGKESKSKHTLSKSKIRFFIKCQSCSKPRGILSKNMIKKADKKRIHDLIHDYIAERNFVCGFNFESFSEEKYKPLAKYELFTGSLSCREKISPYFFELNPKSELVCGWCMGPLSADVKDIYKEKCKISNAVVPNCGKNSYLKMNPAGSAGFFVGRTKVAIKKNDSKSQNHYSQKQSGINEKKKQNRKRKANTPSVQKNKRKKRVN